MCASARPTTTAALEALSSLSRGGRSQESRTEATEHRLWRRCATAVLCVGLSAGTAGCADQASSGPVGVTTTGSASLQPAASAGNQEPPIAGPPFVPCRTPSSAEDISSLPGYVELVVQVHATGRSVPSSLGQDGGSEIETSSAEAVMGSLPHGLHIASASPPTAAALPEGDYLMLLGTYSAEEGLYFTVGGDQGIYALRPDGLLHQQCVVRPGQTGPSETSDGVAADDLLGYVRASTAANAAGLAEVSEGVPTTDLG